MSEEKTHYRKAFNSPYLSSADIVEPTTLTIKCVRLEIDKTKKTKDHFNTAYFVEKEIRHDEALKPMILNATNSRTMKNLAGSSFIEEWNNIPVTIYVEAVRFGRDMVDGLRISSIPPTTSKPVLTPENAVKWQQAINAYRRDGDLDAVLSRATVSDEHQAMIIEQAKNVA